MEVGYRVVRGPDWILDNEDSGEGHVGTIVKVGKNDSNEKSNIGNKTVIVRWDMLGFEAHYRCGTDKKYDLRLLDNAPTGVFHPFKSCTACGEKEIRGIRWECTNCSDYSLCTECYFDKHDMDHIFKRFDSATSRGVKVPKRQDAMVVAAKGIYKGANVTKGPDWDQGGDLNKVGHVITSTTIAKRSYRGGVVVKFDKEATCRVGHNGKVDLICTHPTIWLYYYPDHLPKVAKSDDLVPVGCELKRGDMACVILNAQELKEKIQKPGIEQIATHLGFVTGFSDGEIQVQFRGLKQVHYLPADILKKVEMFENGDTVQLCADESEFRKLQSGHGLQWESWMQQILGKSGVVTALQPNGDLLIQIDAKGVIRNVLVNPGLCTKIQPLPGFQRQTVHIPAMLKGFMEPLLPMLAYQTLGPQNNTLHYAAAIGNLTAVKALVDKHGDKIDEPTEGGNTALHLASVNGRPEVVTHLIENGAQPEIVNDDGRTPVHMAVAGNRPAVLDILIFRKGCNKDTMAKDSQTPLHIAAVNGFVECAKLLMEAKADLTIKDKHGEDTALHHAVRFHQHGVASILMGTKSNLHIRNKFRYTPLHIATLSRNLTAIKAILAKDQTTAKYINEDGSNCLVCAIASGPEFVEALLSKGGNANQYMYRRMYPIEYSMVHGKGLMQPFQTGLVDGTSFSQESAETRNKKIFETIDILLKFKANIEQNNANGERPLHIATLCDYQQILELFLKKGAVINAPTHSGQTALHYAVTQSHMKCVQILLKHHADINYQAKDGSTPLHLAIRHEHIATLLLNDPRIDPSIRDSSGRNCLHLAVMEDSAVIVKSILKKSPDIINVTIAGKKAIHMAAIGGKIESLKALLEMGAQINDQCDIGRTPLMYAAHPQPECSPATVELLVKHGADINIEDMDGYSALLCSLISASVPLKYERASEIKHIHDMITEELGEFTKGYYSVACYLLQHGADLYKENKKRKNVLQMHTISDSDVEDLLVKYHKVGQRKLQQRSGDGSDGGSIKRLSESSTDTLLEANQPIGEVDENFSYKSDVSFTFDQDELGDKVNISRKGSVFRGHYEGRLLAIKEIYIVEKTPKRKREYELLNKTETSRHPNIVGFYGIKSEGSLHFLVMEYCTGTMWDYIHDEEWKQKYLTADVQKDDIKLLMQSIQGIEHLHKLDIIHRDIKPSNILLSIGRGEITSKIGDFGLAKISEGGQDETTGWATQGWMAPELAAQGPKTGIDRPVDIFGMGLCINYLLSGGKHPFDSEELSKAATNTDQRDSLLQCAINDKKCALTNEGGITPVANDLIGKMLAHESNERPCASECLLHPFFMSAEQQIFLLTDANAILEGDDPHAEQMRLDLDANKPSTWEWKTTLGPQMINELDTNKMDKRRNFNSLVEFTRVIRNKRQHLNKMSRNLKLELGSGSTSVDAESYMRYFTQREPLLILYLYRNMEKHAITEPNMQGYFHLKQDCEICTKTTNPAQS